MPPFALTSTLSRPVARLGTLALRSRSPIQTPHYAANTSRGVVPHLAHDNLQKHTDIRALYLGLEDFIEKTPPRVPPVFEIHPDSTGSRLRAFTHHSPAPLLILGPRRVPPVESPAANTNATLSICTSVGFRTLDIEEYISAGAALQPDIIIAPGDIVPPTSSRKRAEKSTDRTDLWVSTMLTRAQETPYPAVFAPLLPLAPEQQMWYTQLLCDPDYRPHISGLAVYDTESLLDLPEELQLLPRLALTTPANPVAILREIALGVDLFILPFVDHASDAGFALDFTFPAPAPAPHADPLPLATSLWSAEHTIDLSPLRPGCTCFACTNHHRAYIHHLLATKEMLGWVLLQLHNHSVMSEFFAGVRQSIARETFEADVEAFSRAYEADMPSAAGPGPRVRGYQFKSKGHGEPKANPKAYNKLDDMAENIADATMPDPDIDAEELQEHGLGKALEDEEMK
ncbi:tRNA-guanine transglycosylase [Trichodelitschia bisporula]|uniref:Queuine tRNA-ribosyltransferase accessory subunit 2 n=1 Tax=Trichodelitschia bisporula TaxID=703511 RepID=A0A6G1I4H5_9PEZI|nr:tRNA-guanine transglycosylase [Trichodelitschia bisporula]